MSTETNTPNGSQIEDRHLAAPVDVHAILTAARRARAEYMAERTGHAFAALGRVVARLLHALPRDQRPAIS
ncbi:MAG: hypothetical protein QNJ94_05035 [Alphaproteobacteria bacterium]|nr:hypothetical protein [Alphaproteobacteria bacterium]